MCTKMWRHHQTMCFKKQKYITNVLFKLKNSFVTHTKQVKALTLDGQSIKSTCKFVCLQDQLSLHSRVYKTKNHYI